LPISISLTSATSATFHTSVFIAIVLAIVIAPTIVIAPALVVIIIIPPGLGLEVVITVVKGGLHKVQHSFTRSEELIRKEENVPCKSREEVCSTYASRQGHKTEIIVPSQLK
jgi:hypothetical protein